MSVLINPYRFGGGGGAGGITVVETAGYGNASTVYNFSETLLENDLVIRAWANDINTQWNSSGQTAGYTNAIPHLAINGVPNIWIEYKFMGATPDTSVRTGTGSKVCNIIYVLRGVDTTTPQDATAVRAEPALREPPPITTVTDGALVIAVGGLDDDGDAVVIAWPTGYTDQVEANTGGTSGSALAFSSKIVPTAGVEDPTFYQWNFTDGSNGYTTAWRPA